MKNLTWKSIDVMKKTKDAVTNQLSAATKESLLTAIALTGATHVAISVPMDDQATFVANGSTPSPRTISAETQDWCDRIHNHGMGVIHRGTFCATENIWGAAFAVLPTGTSASAATDGNSTWCGKYYTYLHTNVGSSHVASGDMFSPIPEGTTHAFDGHYFWTGGTQANYVGVYAQLHAITTSFATETGKIFTFMSHNNYSEVKSGWINSSLYTNEGYAGFDYYGQYQGSRYNMPTDYVFDLEAVYNFRAQPMFWSEWGDLPGAIPSRITTTEDRQSYLINFYQKITEVVNTGMLVGFNYWGGWEGQNTSILYLDSNNQFQLNARGQILRSFYIGGGQYRVTAADATNSAF